MKESISSRMGSIMLSIARNAGLGLKSLFLSLFCCHSLVVANGKIYK